MPTAPLCYGSLWRRKRKFTECVNDVVDQPGDRRLAYPATWAVFTVRGQGRQTRNQGGHDDGREYALSDRLHTPSIGETALAASQLGGRPQSHSRMSSAVG